jgi:hypothetical protein
MDTEDRVVNTDLVVNEGRERFGPDIIRLEGRNGSRLPGTVYMMAHGTEEGTETVMMT